MNKLLLLILLLFIAVPGLAQQKDADSLKIYKDIEQYARKKKGIVYSLYRSVFRPVSKLTTPSKKVKAPRKDISLDKFNGKIIREIIIDHDDPFGYSINDTSIHPKNFVQRFGNNIHARTKRITIKNKLLFKANEPFDPYLVRESERLLRQSSYIRDVMIYAKMAGQDSVDVYIRTIDLWSIVARVSATPSSFKIRLIERNFLGLGHEFDNTIYDNHSNGTYAYEGIYTLSNIKNSFINTSIYYSQDEEFNSTKGLNVERTFYSPVAKWAGGFAAFQSITTSSFIYTDTIYTFTGVRYDQLDLWGAKSWRLEKGASESKRSANLITSARLLTIDYKSRPRFEPDTFRLLQNQQFYLASIGVNKRNYFKDEYLFKFGNPEVVPIGGVASVTFGYQNREFDDRLYGGIKLSAGKYFLPGYAAINFEYGTFFRNGQPEQGMVIGDLIYFSPLYVTGKWRFRQFFKTDLTWGIKRLGTDVITINDDKGLQGFNSEILYGTKSLVGTLQTQVYTPFEFIGFRFAPVLYLAGAFISKSEQPLFNNRFYSSIGFGVLIKNELLVLNTFQISIAYYPVIPGVDNNVFKVNPVKTYDFQFRDFDMEKPYYLSF
jgi:hypothetical protein